MAQDRIFTFIKGQSKGDRKMKELVSVLLRQPLHPLLCPGGLLAAPRSAVHVTFLTHVSCPAARWQGRQPVRDGQGRRQRAPWPDHHH
jgi:hypothetical protein